eukprot:522580-Prymnesium_polylepis.1
MTAWYSCTCGGRSARGRPCASSVLADGHRVAAGAEFTGAAGAGLGNPVITAWITRKPYSYPGANSNSPAVAEKRTFTNTTGARR